MADAPEDWPLNLADLEAPAAELLDRDAYDYYRSGGGDEITLGRNRAAFDEIRLLPHVLRNVSEISLERTLLGSPSSMPIAVAPTAFHGLADPEAELATARGATAADAIFCLSSLSNTEPEAVAAANKCREGGIRVKMITGDHAVTGAAIARQVGARQPGKRNRREDKPCRAHSGGGCKAGHAVPPDRRQICRRQRSGADRQRPHRKVHGCARQKRGKQRSQRQSRQNGEPCRE